MNAQNSSCFDGIALVIMDTILESKHLIESAFLSKELESTFDIYVKNHFVFSKKTQKH